jgi:hypothetical protein
LWIIEKRARDHAAQHGLTFDFIWNAMLWKTLVPMYRTMMSAEALCGCGHLFDNERDIQIDHNEPPRFPGDHARMHARNITLRCASCNKGKSNKPLAQWLDEQEQARLSNEVDRTAMTLFDQQQQPVQLSMDV